MADYPGWYPPGQVCYPPELPTYLESVYDLKPITGVPSDEEVVGIHAIIQVANRASGIPGMYSPGLLMQLGDHLFSAQMAVYRSKYTSLLFPSDAVYAPPTLPAHVSVTLEPVSGAPSDEQVTKVQEAIRSYQKYSEIPSMFEPQVSAELSQHLFDIQLARYMHRASEHQPSTRPHEVTQHPTLEGAAETAIDRTEEDIAHTNNAGAGGTVTGSYQLQDAGIRDILERSNQAAERANQLSERSNELIERSNQIVEKNNQLMERSNLPVEQLTQPTDPSSTNQLAERFNELLGRLDQHFGQSNRLVEGFKIAERFNELLGRLDQHFGQSNRLVEGFKAPMEQIGDALRTINKVLVRIQHAIVRSHKGNTPFTIRALVNEKGDVPMVRTDSRLAYLG
ncbi:hypothetical protein RSAG8_06123, partial [Rhizoctonia solani AG-8 WAC10335]